MLSFSPLVWERGLVVGAVGSLAAQPARQAARQDGPCGQILAACAGAGFAPGVEHMRIDETEGLIARQRDPLAGRRQHRQSATGRGAAEKARAAQEPFKIDIAVCEIGEVVDQRSKIAVLAGLHEPEMSLR